MRLRIGSTFIVKASYALRTSQVRLTPPASPRQVDAQPVFRFLQRRPSLSLVRRIVSLELLSMAIIVSHPVAGYDPQSELKVYAALKALPDDWHVIHSVAWLGPRGKRIGDGEADFLLLNPSVGAVVLEVKGGGVEVQNGRWVSEDRHGRVNDIKNPFEQATTSKVNLHKWLKDRLNLYVPTCHAVVFPDIAYSLELGPAAPTEIVIDGRGLSNIEASIARVVNHWRQEAKLSSQDVAAITKALAPTVSVRRTLADAAYDSDAGLLQLTQDQIRAFAMTRKTPRAVVFGGAGTGKTVLACEKARQLRDDGDFVLLTCFNELLARRLSADASLAGVEVKTFHSLCMSLARSAGIPLPKAPDANWWATDAPLVLLDAAERTGTRFDAIVVDEGQDFSGNWIEALEAICKAGDQSHFYVFADEHQRLWDRDWAPDAQRLRLDLTTNCRNARPISQRVAAISGTDVDDLGAKGPPTKWTDLNRVFDAPRITQRIVERLLAEGFTASDIVVLCETAPLAARLREMAVGTTGFCSFGGSGVVTETVGRFKGLEALAVVLVLDGEQSQPPDRNAYVGFSRARSYLNVLGSPSRKASVSWA